MDLVTVDVHGPLVDELHLFIGSSLHSMLYQLACLITLPETNIFEPETKASQKETNLPTINFQVRTVSFREGIFFSHLAEG